jgi:cation diffusion facilitator CzcD-associated flavoprotein CzcO
VQRIDTLVVGGSQAGLASGVHLARRGVDHVVLEAGRIGESWRSRSWDSFTLVTPNWMIALPDLPAGVGGTADSHGFLLEFVGLRFQTSARSDLLYGVAADAERVVDRLLEAGREVPR